MYLAIKHLHAYIKNNVPKEFQISFHVITFPKITITWATKYNKLPNLPGQHASSLSFRAGNRQDLHKSDASEVTARTRAVPHLLYVMPPGVH